MDLLRPLLQALTSDQVQALSILTLVIIQFLKIVVVGLLKRPKPSKGVMRAIVFVAAFPIGFVFADAALPVYEGGDPMAFANEIFALGSAVLIQAGLVYGFILDGLLEFLDAKVLRRDGKTPILAP